MSTEANLAEQTFAESFAAKIDAAQSPVSTPAPSETPAPAAAATDAPAIVPESTSTAPAAGAPDGEKPKDPPADPATPNTSAPDKSAPDATAPEPKSDDADEDEDDDAEEPKPKAEAPSEFADALEREGVKLTLDDVPAEARPFVQQRVKELEAGFTKARQRDTAALVELKSELRFQQERPADHIVALIRSDPKVLDAVNAKLDELEGSPTAAEAHDIVIEDARAKARTAEQGAVAAADTAADAERREVEALETHLHAKLDAAGVKPGKALQRMLADAAALAEAKSGKRALTVEVIDTIVADYAADVAAEREHARKLERRRTRSEYVRDKVTDRATAGLPVKPGTGAPVAPAAPPRPKTDEEFSSQFAARMDAQRRAGAA